MKKTMFFLSLVLFVSSAVFAQEGNIKSKIEQLNKRMSDALIQGKPDLLADMYSDDIISLPSYAPMNKGKDEVLATMKKDFEMGNKITKAEFNTVEVREEGDVVIEVGTYDMQIDMADMEEDFSDKGKYITVWEKDGNDLKILMETWNTDTNPWAEMQEHGEQKKDSTK